MNENDQKLLTNNLMELANLIHLGNLIPHLLNNGVYTNELLQSEIGIGSPWEQTRRMILGLKKRGPLAFDGFITSLVEAGQYEAAQRLRPHISVPSTREKGGEEVFARHLPEITEVVVQKAVEKYAGLPSTACYRMESKPRGLAALFINEVFEGKDELHRLGAVKDKQLLQELFTQLGYTTLVFEDTPSYKMLDILQNFTQREEHANMDSCVVVFSSHGKGDGIMCHDSKLISMNEIRQMFDNDNCPLLSGKPKIFIVQACRGETFDTGVPTSGTDAIGYSPANNKPTATDMLIAYSTAPGYVANRTEKGSWYIYLITEVFMRKAFNTRLDDMLMEVNQRMNRLRADGGEKQAAETVWQGWQRKFFFNPGL